MADQVYPYDQELYGRSFLNCYQRQSIVMLAEAKAPVHELFRAALVSTDDVLQQVVRERRPRYAFESDFFADADLAAIGVTRSDEPADTWAQARPRLLAALERDGFAIPVVDVYYLPHCPEFRSEHLVHTVVLRGWRPGPSGAGEFTVLDDNPASVLCTYTYAEDVLRAAYENGTVRRVRSFPPVTGPPADRFGVDPAGWAGLRARVAAHRDSLALFERVEEILADPWADPRATATALHDAVSLYRGSRIGLRAYLTRAGAPGAAAAGAVGAAVAATDQVLGRLLIGRATGLLDPAALAADCGPLADAERAVLRELGRLPEPAA